MTGRTFIRKHKPTSKHKAEKTARVAAEKSATTASPTTHAPSTTPASSATPQNQNLGMNYQSGLVFNLAAADLERAQNDEQFIGQTEPSFFEKQLDAPPKGTPLEPAQRRQLERRFGRSFAHVQIHKGPLASALTETVGATAFAYRQHIWLGDRADKSDTKLLAHELTHVVQQGYAPDIQYRTPIALNPPANDSTHAVGQQRAAPNHASAPMGGNVAPAGGVVQGFDLWDSAVSVGGAIVSTASDVVDFVGDIPGNLADMGFEAAKGVLRRVAPNFLALFENDGITGFLNRIIQRGVRSLFSGILETIRRTVNIDNFAAGFEEATSWLGTITSEMSANACDTILSAARHVREFFSDTFGPIVDKVSGIACQIKGFLNGIWESIGAPIWDFLRNIGGEIWESVQGLISDAADLIRSARRVLGSAWDTVKEWLGIEAEDGESEGGGLWEWIREKASDIGTTISEVLEPIMGPLRDAAGVLLLFVPGGQIFAVMLLWPRLRQAFDWISGVWEDLNLIPRARTFLTETVFPFLMDAAESVAQALLAHADWMIGNLSRLVGMVQGLVGGIPDFLAPFRPVASFMLRLFQRILGFASTGIRYVSRHFRSLMRRLMEFLELVGRVLVRIISIVLNPFGLVGFLVGMLWQLLPDCIKGPLINFILDILIGFIRLIPDNPLLGIIWPVIKAGLLGFLESVRDLELSRKVDISNKVANIVAGGSPSFILGYFTGIITGLWQAITGPIQAIAMIFELPTMIQNFLGNLGVRLCEIIEQIRCFASNLASEVFGRVDNVLSSIQEFLSDPSRILSLIRCAVEGILSGARSLGSQLATHMIGVFEGPDEDIGRMLGNITGQMLFQSVLAFFTAGAGTAVSSGLTIVNRIAGVLRTVGRAIGRAVRVLRQLLGRLVRFVRGLASRLGSAVARGGRNIFSRLGSFFGRFTRWLARIGRRAFSAVRRRFGLTPQQRLRWRAFTTQARTMATRYPSGTTKANLRTAFRTLRSQYRDVAKWPAFITKHGPHWRLWARRVKSIRPRRVGRVLMDPRNRLRAGMRVVRQETRQLKRREENINDREIQHAIRNVVRRYRFISLNTVFNESSDKFEVTGRTNPPGTVNVKPNRPQDNEIIENSPSRSATAILSHNRVRRSSASGTPPFWNTVRPIRLPAQGDNSRSSGVALYVKGHIIGGFWAPGSASNLTPITRKANEEMESRMETPIRMRLASPNAPVLRYQVETQSASAGTPPQRKVSGAFRCVADEKQLVSGIRMTLFTAKYNRSTQKWDRRGRRISGPTTVSNVPRRIPHHSFHGGGRRGYPIGWAEIGRNRWC